MAKQCFIDMGNSRIKWWLCEDGQVIASHACWHKQNLAEFAAELPAIFHQPVDFGRCNVGQQQKVQVEFVFNFSLPEVWAKGFRS